MALVSWKGIPSGNLTGVCAGFSVIKYFNFFTWLVEMREHFDLQGLSRWRIACSLCERYPIQNNLGKLHSVLKHLQRRNVKYYV